jgi:hypothetical protein
VAKTISGRSTVALITVEKFAILGYELAGARQKVIKKCHPRLLMDFFQP